MTDFKVGVQLHPQHATMAELRQARTAGRDPAEVERTVGVLPDELGLVPELVDAGAQHFILRTAHPFDLEPVRRLLATRAAS